MFTPESQHKCFLHKSVDRIKLLLWTIRTHYINVKDYFLCRSHKKKNVNVLIVSFCLKWCKTVWDLRCWQHCAGECQCFESQSPSSVRLRQKQHIPDDTLTLTKLALYPSYLPKLIIHSFTKCSVTSLSIYTNIYLGLKCKISRRTRN